MSDQLPPQILYCHQVVENVIYQSRLKPHEIRMVGANGTEPRLCHEWHDRRLIIRVDYDGLLINDQEFPIRGHLTVFHAVMNADAGVIENAMNRKKENIFWKVWQTLLHWIETHPIKPTLAMGFNPETQEGDAAHWGGPDILYLPRSGEPKRLIVQIHAQSELHRRLNEALHNLGPWVESWCHNRFRRHLSMDGVNTEAIGLPAGSTDRSDDTFG